MVGRLFHLQSFNTTESWLFVLLANLTSLHIKGAFTPLHETMKNRPTETWCAATNNYPY